MEKVALKTYKDPMMNSLVQHKAGWNRAVSAFINDIIHYKKLMNGHPNKFYQQKASILYPIPADPATVIDQLMSEFQRLASEAQAIVQEQNAFVSERNKKHSIRALDRLDKAHPEETPAQPQQGVDLAKQIKASNEAAAYYLITEASNPLTRFFTKIMNPGIGLSGEAARIRNLRMSLLNFTADINKNLKLLQKYVVGSGAQSIFNANQLFERAQDNYVFLSSGVHAAKEALPKGVETGGEISVKNKEETEEAGSDQSIDFAQSPVIQSLLLLVNDIRDYSHNFKGLPERQQLEDKANKIRNAINNQNVKFIEASRQSLLNLYNKALLKLCMIKNIPQQSSLADIMNYEKLQKAKQEKEQQISSTDDQLQVTAQNIAGKWRHQLSPFDKTSAFRLDIYKAAKASREIANKIMNHLEKKFDIEEMNTMVIDLGNSLFAIRPKMEILMKATRGVAQPQFLSMLEKGKLSDYGIDLDPKEKATLQKKIRDKRLLDLAKKYMGR